jgi:hypothetical protein
VGNVIWWVGVLALALFMELCHRIGLLPACQEIWDFAASIGPRDEAVRRGVPYCDADTDPEPWPIRVPPQAHWSDRR